MNRLQALFISLLISFFASCGQNKMPSFKMPSGSDKDSLIFALWLGDSISKNDTLLMAQEEVEVSPDSNLYKEVYITYDKSPIVRYYQLRAGSWSEAKPQRPKTKLSKFFPECYIQDIHKKYHSLRELASKHRLAIYFAGLNHQMPKKSAIKQIKDKYPKDSLNFLFMYLSPSDSMARRLMKQDSLKGLAFSDSLGEVSRLRDSLGIGRSNKLEVFVVDSNLLIHRSKK